MAAFAAALDAHAERVLRPADLVAVERVDAVVGGDELGMALAEELQALAPFGRGNPAVSLMVADATFHDARADGRRQARALHGRSRAAPARARSPSAPAARLPVPDGEPAEATFTLEVNEWNGVIEPRLVLRHAVRRRRPRSSADAAWRELGRSSARTELVLFALP